MARSRSGPGIVILVGALALAVAVAACDRVARAGVWLQIAAQPAVERDLIYCSVEGVDLTMDLYRPTVTGRPAPVVVFVHGGGWTAGDKGAVEGVRAIPELTAKGFVVAAVNYRLAPAYRFPAQIEDVKCAVRHLRANAERYGIDPSRIGAWGGSAGGHLVALLGLASPDAGFEGAGGYDDQSSRVQAVVDMYGPSDLPLLYGRSTNLAERVFGGSGPLSETLVRASPISYVTGEAPPFLLLHGDSDRLVPAGQSHLLHDRLTAAGVPSTLVLVKNAGHGFAPSGGAITPSRAELIRMIVDFFEMHLGQAG